MVLKLEIVDFEMFPFNQLCKQLIKKNNFFYKLGKLTKLKKNNKKIHKINKTAFKSVVNILKLALNTFKYQKMF